MCLCPSKTSVMGTDVWCSSVFGIYFTFFWSLSFWFFPTVEGLLVFYWLFKSRWRARLICSLSSAIPTAGQQEPSRALSDKEPLSSALICISCALSYLSNNFFPTFKPLSSQKVDGLSKKQAKAEAAFWHVLVASRRKESYMTCELDLLHRCS